jgi:hypothetical protein
VNGTIEVCVACKVMIAPEPEVIEMDAVSGRMPPSEIESDCVTGTADDGVVMACVSNADVVKREVEVDNPLAGQFERPRAQLITVTTLVTEAIEMGIGAAEGGTAGCEVKASELVRRPPTTLLGCISGVANTCPVGPYIKSAASSILPSSLAWFGVGLTSSNSVQSPLLLSVSALKLIPTQKEVELELLWLYEAHCKIQAVNPSAGCVIICWPVYVVEHWIW